MHGRRHVKEAGLQEEVVNLTLRAKKNDRGLPVSKSLGSPCVPAAALVLLCFRDLPHHGSRSFSVLTSAGQSLVSLACIRAFCSLLIDSCQLRLLFLWGNA